MKKKAVCVGINDYPYDGSDLNGCVNDARGWAALLREHYDFAASDVKVLLDSEATKKNIMERLEWLLAGAAAGDVLVFTNASHGTYVPDRDGDEAVYDEALCPYDTAEVLIVDDELRQLFGNVKEGVHLTVVADSCHSGTVTRAAVGDNIPGRQTPDDRRVRFLSPALRGGRILANPWKAKPRAFERYPQSEMKEVLLAGCSDKEYANDAFIDGRYQGAMSAAALRVIREANYALTYAQLHARVCHYVERDFPQHPQLEGRRENLRRQIFV